MKNERGKVVDVGARDQEGKWRQWKLSSRVTRISDTDKGATSYDHPSLFTDHKKQCTRRNRTNCVAKYW